MTTVYIGMGSNLGRREENLRQALELLASKVKVVKVSPVYDTAPVGNADQARFLNLVCEVKTGFTPSILLTFVKEIEKQMGRVPGPPNSPRPIDIDILFYGDLLIDTPQLVIPHPRLTERAFVLLPLADIAPRKKNPATGKTVIRLLKELPRTAGDAVIIKEATNKTK